MGIPGLYKEIEPTKRISLAKLAVNHIETTGVQYRIAIDMSIWFFQAQAGAQNAELAQKGKESEKAGKPRYRYPLRILYFRLLKLVSLSIQPLFVFDGKDRPNFKRGKVIPVSFKSPLERCFKRLLEVFKLPYHNAPGEAEAECAVLQQHGIVDAVFTEDVDAIMFGSSVTIGQWGGLYIKDGKKSPTHVNIYETAHIQKTSNLSREGMILVAMMGGGDYGPGLPHCGPATATLAAKAGFGDTLCNLHPDDTVGLTTWRRHLQHELQTNESGHFRQKSNAIVVPAEFPRKDILRNYTHPLVSSKSDMLRLRSSLLWKDDLDVQELRDFVAEYLDWTDLEGAKQYIQSLAPALLIDSLVRRSQLESTNRESLGTKTRLEGGIVKYICGISGTTGAMTQSQTSVDGEPQLRIAYVPLNIVDIDLSAEVSSIQSERYHGEFEQVQGAVEPDALEIGDAPPSPSKRASRFDPMATERLWVLETFMKLGCPLMVETYEEDLRASPKKPARRPRQRGVLTKTLSGPMDGFVKVIKSRNNKNFSDKALTRCEDPSPYQTPTKARMERSPTAQPINHCGESPKKILFPATQTTKRNPEEVIDLSSSPLCMAIDAPPTVQLRNRSQSPEILDLSIDGSPQRGSSLNFDDSRLDQILQENRSISPVGFSASRAKDHEVSRESSIGNVTNTLHRDQQSTFQISDEQSHYSDRDSRVNRVDLKKRRAVQITNVDNTDVNLKMSEDLNTSGQGRRRQAEYRKVMLRPSLTGSWRVVEDDDGQVDGQEVFHDVQVIDLAN